MSDTSYIVDCKRPDSSEWYYYSTFKSLDSAEVVVKIQRSPGETREKWKFRITKIETVKVSTVVYEG